MTGFIRTLAMFFVAALLVVTGCKKTAEGQTKSWKANTAKVDKLQAQYPGFKAPLEARLSSAKSIFESASSLSGEEQVDKMSEANQKLMAGFVGKLGGLEASVKELRDKRVEAAAKAGDESSRLAAKVAADDAGKTLERIESVLKEGAADEAAANAILEKVTADLATAQSAVDKVLEVDGKKKKDKADAADAKAEAEAKAKADAEAKVADWKCQYCGSMNKHDHTDCKSCGAPRAGKKDTKAEKK